MPIPKVIHYCWFGKKPVPGRVKKCIESWKRHCPDYRIIRWDETNFDVGENRYIREAYESGKWAFVSDYARLKIVYENGGIYLDTDVKLLRPLDALLGYEGFMGFQRCGIVDGTAFETVATGLGFGASLKHPVIGLLAKEYQSLYFLGEDGTMDLTPCPDRNTRTLMKLGLRPDGTRQEICGMQIFPAEYFCPLGWGMLKAEITANTYAIHLFEASWIEDELRWRIVRRLCGSSACYRLRYQFLPEQKGRIRKLLGRRRQDT